MTARHGRSELFSPVFGGTDCRQVTRTHLAACQCQDPAEGQKDRRLHLFRSHMLNMVNLMLAAAAADRKPPANKPHGSAASN